MNIVEFAKLSQEFCAEETYERDCEALRKAYNAIPVTDVLEVDIKCKCYSPKTTTLRSVRENTNE